MLKSLSRLVFVSSMAISQNDPMAVFGASGRRSVGTGYWIPLREVQGLYGALTYGVQSDFVVTCSGGLFGLFGPLRPAKRAAQMSRPSWVGFWCWSVLAGNAEGLSFRRRQPPGTFQGRWSFSAFCYFRACYGAFERRQ